jgi:dihydrofolate reductase
MINCIVAVEQNQGIGFQGSMPWPRLKGDLKWFKELTTNHVVIMGSVTWRSLPYPLPDRINIVLSKNNYNGATACFRDSGSALDYCLIQYPKKEIFIIGGQAIYDQYISIDIIDRCYVTEISASYKCDKFFNLNYVKENFPVVIEHVKYPDIIPYTFKEYRKL